MNECEWNQNATTFITIHILSDGKILVVSDFILINKPVLHYRGTEKFPAQLDYIEIM